MVVVVVVVVVVVRPGGREGACEAVQALQDASAPPMLSDATDAALDVPVLVSTPTYWGYDYMNSGVVRVGRFRRDNGASKLTRISGAIGLAGGSGRSGGSLPHYYW
jgi:hypothetical protein